MCYLLECFDRNQNDYKNGWARIFNHKKGLENLGEYTMKIIVVDVQKGITDERLYNFKGFIENVSRIIDTARRNNVEVIYVQHDDGPGTGFSIGDKDFEIADQVAPMAGREFL